jgi:hypothetical protein
VLTHPTIDGDLADALVPATVKAVLKGGFKP